MVNADRVKVIVTMTGESVWTDLQEAVDKDTNERKAYVFNYPYKVTYSQPKLDGTGLVTDPEVKVNYEPWNALTSDVRIAVSPSYVVTILEPVPSLRDTYIENVRKMGGDVE